jgi:hypothetical protein
MVLWKKEQGMMHGKCYLGLDESMLDEIYGEHDWRKVIQSMSMEEKLKALDELILKSLRKNCAST